MSASILKSIADGRRPAAVRECIDRYSALIWSIARRLSRTTADAEDALQEIFLDIWRCANRFDPSQGTEAGFIMVIARRRLIDRLRKVSSEPVMTSIDAVDLTELWCTSTHHAENLIESEQALKILRSIRFEHRQVLELSLLQGLSQCEIAVALDLPLGTVKSFMRRGLTRLRQGLDPTSVAVTRKAATPRRRKRGLQPTSRTSLSIGKAVSTRCTSP